MASSLDPSDFVDTEYEQSRRAAAQTGAPGQPPPRAPSRQEVTAQITDVQAELARLKQEQEQLERERAQLAETERRQAEWQTGRQEIIQSITRGIGLLEEAEFSARQEAEQMGKSIAGLKDAVTKVQAVSEETWTAETLQVEMTRALTTLENARMEWNSARLKFPLLNQAPADPALPLEAPKKSEHSAAPLTALPFFQLCRLGLALTWPIAAGILIIVLTLVLRSR